MFLYLMDTMSSMVAAWKQEFKNYLSDQNHLREGGVKIHEGSIFDLASPTLNPKCSCFVSPANSFGFMDGGIDLHYSNFFGWDLSKRLQTIIKNKYQGELLIGQAEILTTKNMEVPYLIAAPTMRVPELLVESINAYLATRATLRLAVANKLPSIAFPGMGTGIGRLPVAVCAKQMRAAYEEVILGKIPQHTTFKSAIERHYGLVNG